MDDKSSSLKLKLNIFFSAESDRRQDQEQLTAKENKKGSLTGLLTYASGLMIGRNHCSGKIKPAKFSDRPGKAKKFLER